MTCVYWFVLARRSWGGGSLWLSVSCCVLFCGYFCWAGFVSYMLLASCLLFELLLLIFDLCFMLLAFGCGFFRFGVVCVFVYVLFALCFVLCGLTVDIVAVRFVSGCVQLLIDFKF